MNKKLIKNMTVTALMTAVLCVVSPFTIQIGVIPLSLATFIVMLSAVLLGAKRGTVSVILYILIGIIGLPVFSGFGSGIAKVAGPTGGYLLGYIFLSFIIGFAADKWTNKIWVYPIAMVIGTIVLYAFGTAWYMIQSGNPLGAALTACVAPFIPGDIVKIIVAVAVGYPLRRLLVKQKLI